MSRHRWLVATAAPAVIVPALLAFNLPPSATFLNQAAALIGWGGFALALTTGVRGLVDVPGRAPVGSGLIALLTALSLMALAAAGSAFVTGLPWSLAASAIGTLAAAVVVATAAAVAARNGQAAPAFYAFCVALVVAGVLSTLLAVVQVFVPTWADGHLISAASVPGRASGNLRQPNHLSSLLLWSLVAALWLGEAGRLARLPVLGLCAAFVFALVLSGSRTGTISVVILGLWGVLDGRLSRGTRAWLVATPLLYAVCWFGLAAWAHDGHAALINERRFSGEGDISASRFGIWSNTLVLIARHPWLGVGWGEFNFAWSLTPFPGRPVAFFDHTHNLPLQFAVELGLPLAVVLMALLSFALWRAFAAGNRAAAADTVLLRAAFMMVLMLALHSQLEYPLWYAYFLLPTAFAFGLCLGADTPATGSAAGPTARRSQASAFVVPSSSRSASSADRGAPWRAAARPLTLASLLVIGGGVWAVFDYLQVVAIFQPGSDADPLAGRIQRGQHSWFFSHHADYAAATTEPAAPAAGLGAPASGGVAQMPMAVRPAAPSGAPGRFAAFAGATRYLLDTRLMVAWADALNAAGDTQRARHLAQRLREFRNPDAADYFDACDDPAADSQLAGADPAAPVATQLLPYQCTPPTQDFDYRDFADFR